MEHQGKPISELLNSVAIIQQELQNCQDPAKEIELLGELKLLAARIYIETDFAMLTMGEFAEDHDEIDLEGEEELGDVKPDIELDENPMNTQDALPMFAVEEPIGDSPIEESGESLEIELPDVELGVESPEIEEIVLDLFSMGSFTPEVHVDQAEEVKSEPEVYGEEAMDKEEEIVAAPEQIVAENHVVEEGATVVEEVPVFAPPIVETSVVAVPVVEAPVMEMPVMEAPVIEVPVFDAPVVNVSPTPAVSTEPVIPTSIVVPPLPAETTSPAETPAPVIPPSPTVESHVPEVPVTVDVPVSTDVPVSFEVPANVEAPAAVESPAAPVLSGNSGEMPPPALPGMNVEAIINQMPISRRFEFANMLFAGDVQRMGTFIHELLQSPSGSARMDVYERWYEENNWRRRDEAASDLLRLIKRIFPG